MEKFDVRPVEFERFWIKLQSEKAAEWINEESMPLDLDSFVEDVLNILSYKPGVFGLDKEEIEDIISVCWHENFDPSYAPNPLKVWD